MSKNDTVEGYPGGNWPSKTGAPSGGGRGNAPSDADWGWDDDADVDASGLMHRNELQTQQSLQELPSPPGKAKPWQIEGEIEFITLTPGCQKLKLKADDTVYHLDERLLPALGRRGEIECLRNSCPGDYVAAMVYQKIPGNSLIYVYRVHLKDWNRETWEERAKGGGLLGVAFNLNKQAYENYQDWINTERTVRLGSRLSSETCPPEAIATLRQTRPSDLSNAADPIFRGQPEMIDAVAYLFDEQRTIEVQSYLRMRYGQPYSPGSIPISKMIEDVQRNVKARLVHDP
ncbi:hypothetical protein [Salicola sp. Rm-C-2C1-2]|uniref:hypothetical protein n=1 Tax=Salicola sp. Rm-C-2C1-2 TaxID=3141321 RepID=UPI0032E5130E